MSISIKPRFITFEGIDGCGKSTQAELLNNYLLNNNIQSIIVREPGGTSISEKIRDILLSNINSSMSSRTEALLMTASRAQLTKEKILPQLKSDSWIVSDRYSDSTLAYQGGGRDMNINWLKTLNLFATFETIPDLTFYLDIPVDIIPQRQTGSLDRFEEEGLTFLNKVRNAYIALADIDKERIISIDGTKHIDQIHKSIIETIEEKGFFTT